jgi:hypothetical protein
MPLSRRGWFLALPLLLAPRTAHATDAVAAQALFDEAKQLMADGRYTAACPKFAESQQADPGLGTQFHLADCWQHVGRVASAWALFRDVESQARARGEASRERVAHDRAAALEPFLPKLSIVPRPGETAGMTIRRDGTEIGREQWGVEVPVDPGTHDVAVYAPGKQPWGTGVEVPMAGGIVTVDVPSLLTLPNVVPMAAASPARPPAPAAMPAPAATGTAATATVAPPGTGSTSMMPGNPGETPVIENPGGVQRAIGWFFVGAGVVGLASGGYFTSQWLSYRDQSDPLCPGGSCTPSGAQLRSNSTSQGRAAIIAGGGGALSLIIGAALVAMAPGPRVVPSPTAARLEVVPIVDAHRGGLGLQGVW